MPLITLTRVDLPAPLSPTRATTSPGYTSKSTSERAWPPPKRLLIPCRSSSGARTAVLMRPNLLTGGRGGGWPPAAARTAARVMRTLLDARGLAGVGVGRRADLLRSPEAVLDDRVLDIVLG